MTFSVLALLALAGPTANQSASQSLFGRTWVLAQISPRGTPMVIKPSHLLRPPTLQFVTPQLVAGSTACNGYAAQVNLTAHSFKVGRVILKGTSNCPDAVLGLETDFVHILESATTYQLSQDHLTIQGSAGLSLTLRANPTTPQQNPPERNPDMHNLSGNWTLTTLAWQGHPVNVPPESGVTLEPV